VEGGGWKLDQATGMSPVPEIRRQECHLYQMSGGRDATCTIFRLCRRSYYVIASFATPKQQLSIIFHRCPDKINFTKKYINLLMESRLLCPYMERNYTERNFTVRRLQIWDQY